MKRHFLVMLMMAGALFSCRENAHEEIPEGIIPQEKMAHIMLDVYLLEARSRNLRIKMDSARKIFRYYEGEIFDDHGVSDSVYRASIEFYTSHPHHLSGIYEIMVDSLSLRERLDGANIRPGD